MSLKLGDLVIVRVVRIDRIIRADQYVQSAYYMTTLGHTAFKLDDDPFYEIGELCYAWRDEFDNNHLSRISKIDKMFFEEGDYTELGVL